jgi:acetylornithine deacetylase/succinyl-diaminopimelate desuccinylase-like protein
VEPSRLEPLLELLRIPSVSADPAHAADLQAALEWVAAFVERAGGEARFVDGVTGPIVVGELAASRDPDRAPTVLCYGHVDVQPPAPLGLWESPPFEPTVRDGWLYCRGVADDKGQLWLLLEAARSLAAEGALPVNVRFLCDAEEEVGGRSAAEWVERDERGADACVVFDTSMLAGGLPAFSLGTRGTAYFHLTVRTGRRDVHSGVYGGAGLNALHALVAALDGVLPRDGRLPEPLRAGTIPPSDDEVACWAGLPPGDEVLAGQGVVPADDRAAGEFYARTWAEPALDVHGLEGGSPQLMSTVVVARAEANLSLRPAHGQSVASIAPVLERLLREAAPAGASVAGASVELELLPSTEPSFAPAGAGAVTLGLDAFERALGIRPVLVRTGGSLPLVPELAARGIPAVITGFDVPDGNIHAPNERFRLEHFDLGLAAARELLLAYAGLR